MKLADDEAEVQTLFKIDAEIVGSISSHESDQSAAAVSTINNQQALPVQQRQRLLETIAEHSAPRILHWLSWVVYILIPICSERLIETYTFLYANYTFF